MSSKQNNTFENLLKNNPSIACIELNFSGGGDSGGVDSYLLHKKMPDGTLDEIPSNELVGNSNLDTLDIEMLLMEVMEACDNTGWENNEGGEGCVFLDAIHHEGRVFFVLDNESSSIKNFFDKEEPSEIQVPDMNAYQLDVNNLNITVEVSGSGDSGDVNSIYATDKNSDQEQEIELSIENEERIKDIAIDVMNESVCGWEIDGGSFATLHFEVNALGKVAINYDESHIAVVDDASFDIDLAPFVLEVVGDKFLLEGDAHETVLANYNASKTAPANYTAPEL